MKDWTEEHCSQQPSEIESISDGFLMQRRNIHEVKHEADKENGNGEYSEWVCESREISVAEYQELHAQEIADMNAAIDDLTVASLTGGN